jgi:hypothetical protein
VCLLCIHGDDGERIWKTEDIALGKSVGCDDYLGVNISMLQRNKRDLPVILIFFLL